jgi:PAS domain S-box-containing protein
MKDDEKTREQLVNELKELRLQNAALQKSITVNKATRLVEQDVLRYTESILETIQVPLLLLDAALKIILANRIFYSTFNVAPAETIGSFIYDLGNKQWAIPKLLELLENILPKKEVFNDFEVEHIFKNIGHKVMLLNARQIYRADIDSKIILLAIEDITERKRLENILAESEYIFRRTYETANDAILLLEKSEGKIAHANPATEKMLGYTEKESIGNKLSGVGVLLDMGNIKTILQTLDDKGIIHYSNVPIKAKSGKNLYADIYLVNKATLLQCNIRDITDRKKANDLLEELNRAFVGRELRMVELKKQIAELEKKEK